MNKYAAKRLIDLGRIREILYEAYINSFYLMGALEENELIVKNLEIEEFKQDFIDRTKIMQEALSACLNICDENEKDDE